MLATWWDLVLRVPAARPLVLAAGDPDTMHPDILGLENDTMVSTVTEDNLRASIRPGGGELRRAIRTCGVYVMLANGNAILSDHATR